VSDTQELPLIVSLDDHVMEPPHVWQERLPAKYRAVGPRVERRRFSSMVLKGGVFRPVYADDGALEGDVWLYEDVEMPIAVNLTAAGLDYSEHNTGPNTFDKMRPGAYIPSERLKDMDLDGVEAEMCFPNAFVRFCGQTFTEAKDRELALLCVKAYNDWIVEEWCGEQPGRQIPNCIVPLWDADLAAAEVHRNAARGVRAVAFSEAPTYLGLPSIHSGSWEPFFRACDETGTLLTMHIGSGSKLTTTSDDAPQGLINALTFNTALLAVADWIFSGALVRYPNLRLLFAEAQIGWVPFLLERFDRTRTVAAAWGEFDLPELPSFYFHRQCYCTFFDDPHGLRSLAEVGFDNAMFETDFPHNDSTFPHSRRRVAEFAEIVDAELLHKIVRGNAIKLMGLDL
jgi:predicted TIM-barrel fold metal-dependent hydrolase